MAGRSQLQGWVRSITFVELKLKSGRMQPKPRVVCTMDCSQRAV